MDRCPNCSAPRVIGDDDGEILFDCGSRMRRTARNLWRLRLVTSHKCVQHRACADASLTLVKAALDSNARARTWYIDDVQSSTGQDFGQWSVTVASKKPKPTPKKARK